MYKKTVCIKKKFMAVLHNILPKQSIATSAQFIACYFLRIWLIMPDFIIGNSIIYIS